MAVVLPTPGRPRNRTDRLAAAHDKQQVSTGQDMPKVCQRPAMKLHQEDNQGRAHEDGVRACRYKYHSRGRPSNRAELTCVLKKQNRSFIAHRPIHCAQDCPANATDVVEANFPVYLVLQLTLLTFQYVAHHVCMS